MSLFRSERPSVNRVHFEPTQLPTPGTVSGGTSSGPTPGDLWFDQTTQSFQAVTGVGQVGLTLTAPVPLIGSAVTQTNPTSAANLLTYAIQPNQFNALGKAIHIYGAGEYTTDGGTARTITIAVTWSDGTNTRTLLTWTSGATTASQTNLPWNVEGYITVQAVGSAGTAFAHGTAWVTLGSSAPGATTSYNDTNTAVSSAINLTVSGTLAVNALFSGSNAGNTITQDMLIVSGLN